MIYTVISDINNFKSARESAQKRDCHNQWQPLTLIPKDVISYIENSKNDEVRLERFTAYSTLFFALFELYGKKEVVLCRTDSGNPYLVENGKTSKIRISLSHSDGLAAVALSDEGDIGVDIQSEIDKSRAERLEKRFFADINIKEEIFPHKLFMLSFTEENVKLEEFKNVEAKLDGFTAKWAYCESIMKCDGGGFGSLDKIPNLQEKTKTIIYKINPNSKEFILAITKKVL